MASISNPAAIIAANGYVDALDLGTTNPAGKMRIYAGTPPALVDDALAGNTLLSEHDLSNPAFGGAVDDTPGALATANAIADDTLANNAGAPSFARFFDRDDVARIQMSAGTSGTEVIVNASPFAAGALVSVLSITMFAPEG